MKKFVEQNKITLIMLLVLLVLSLILSISYNINFNKMIENAHYLADLYPEYEIDLSYEEDAYTMFLNIVNGNNFNFICLFFPLVVLIPSIHILKETYTKKKKKKTEDNSVYKRVYMTCLLVPVFLISIFCFSYLFTNQLDSKLNYVLFDFEHYINMPVIFMIAYIFNLTLLSIFYINVGLLIYDNKKTYIFNVFTAFLTILITLVGLLALGFVIGLILDSMVVNTFNLLSFWNYYEIISIEFMILYAFSLAGISTIVTYKKKIKGGHYGK